MAKYFILLSVIILSGCSLLKKASEAKPEEEISYRCGNVEIAVTYQNPETILLKKDGINYLLRQSIAASGAKYESKAAQIIFWNKGEENYLEINGKNYPLCQKV